MKCVNLLPGEKGNKGNGHKGSARSRRVTQHHQRSKGQKFNCHGHDVGHDQHVHHDGHDHPMESHSTTKGLKDSIIIMVIMMDMMMVTIIMITFGV